MKFAKLRTRRDRLRAHRAMLNTFFKSNAFQTRSGTLQLMTFFYDIGRTHKSFFGTPAACFERYKTYCEKQNAPSKSVVRSSSIFHRERKAQGLGVEMGYACDKILFVAHIVVTPILV